MSKEASFTYSPNPIYICYDIKDGRIISIYEPENLYGCNGRTDQELEDEILNLATTDTDTPKSETGILKVLEELSSDVGYKVDTRKKKLVTREDTKIRKK
jgi:hypothetical protein